MSGRRICCISSVRCLAADHNVRRLMTIWKVPSVLATFAGLAVGMSGVVAWGALLQSIRCWRDLDSADAVRAGRMSDSADRTPIKLGWLARSPLIGMVIAAALLAVMIFRRAAGAAVDLCRITSLRALSSGAREGGVDGADRKHGGGGFTDRPRAFVLPLID